MLRSLSTAASGMKAQQTKLDVTANNIANASTTGFKKSRVDFENVMVQEQKNLEVGMGVRAANTSRQQSQGQIQQTGNELDVAILGQGFFQVTLPNGQTAYTRNGNFQRDDSGRLVLAGRKYPVVGDLEIPDNAEHVTVGADGVLSALITGEPEAVEIGQIELATFANPSGLRAGDHNVFFESDESGAPVTGAPGENGTGELNGAALEGSNVSIVEEMVDLISGQRAYEVNSRVIRASDEMLQQAAQLR